MNEGAQSVLHHLIMKRAFTLYADYHQFYVEDEQSAPETAASPDFWNARALADGLASACDMMAVGTARYGNVQVEIEVRDDEPPDDSADWDQVVEAAIEIPSGNLIVRGCTEERDTAQRFSVAPGTYQARVCYSGLDVEDPDAEEGDDHYRVVLWPGAWREPRVTKRFEGGVNAASAAEANAEAGSEQFGNQRGDQT